MTVRAEPASATLLHARPGRVDLVDVPEFLFARFDGHGSPESPDFARAVQALYSIAYGVHFAMRVAGTSERVSPLEALWSFPGAAGADSADELQRRLVAGGKGSWSWRAMIRLPDTAASAEIGSARDKALRRHPELADALQAVAVEPWREGLAVQTLHVGPYDAELPTVELLQEHIRSNGWEARGAHHEIYLGDPRRCAPARLRTILRQPVVRG